MDYKPLIIIMVAGAIICHHFYQEICSMRESAESMKVRIGKLEKPSGALVSGTLVGGATGNNKTPISIIPAPSDPETEDEIIDKRFDQMNEIVARLGTFSTNNKQKTNNIDTDEPSFEVPSGAVWQTNENIASTHVSALYNNESSRAPTHIESGKFESAKSGKISDTSETIMSYAADSAVTIRCWPPEDNGKYTHDTNKSELASDTISIDLTNNSGQLRTIPRMRNSNSGLNLTQEVYLQPISPTRFGRALAELGNLMRKHVELEVGSSGSSYVEQEGKSEKYKGYHSEEESSSVNTGASSSKRNKKEAKNNIRGVVYERK